MAFDLNNIKTDPKKANEGVELPYRGGSKLIVAKHNNKDAENYRMAEMIKNGELFTKVHEGEATDEEIEQADQIAIDVETHILAHFILKGWIGIKRGGKALKYTPELGFDLLSDPENSEFRDDVVRMSRNNANYRPEEKAKATVKKAAASS